MLVASVVLPSRKGLLILGIEESQEQSEVQHCTLNRLVYCIDSLWRAIGRHTWTSLPARGRLI